MGSNPTTTAINQWSAQVLGPQGTLFFLLLVAVFAGLMVWLVMTKQVILRIMAAVLAFIPAMVFGVGVVNKYYDYYQTWGALFSDLSGQGTQAIPQVTAAGLGSGTGKSVSSMLAKATNPSLNSQTGYLFRSMVSGPKSHLDREVYVWLPPQYFSKAYANYKFPAIELLHGSPGNPESWVNVMNIITIYLQQLQEHKSQPAVLVMPDTDGGLKYALQCLNIPHGPQDMTYVGQEVPDWVAANLRVQPPGKLWGVAGYSEGGFCAANIGLQDADRFGYAASLSGYFEPVTGQVPKGGKPGAPPVDENVFAHSPASVRTRNTPEQYIMRVPVGVQVPQFFLAAGALDAGDVQGAQSFRQLLLTRDASVPLDIVPGGGHQAMVWRSASAAMLPWMTNQLAVMTQRVMANEAHQAAQEKAAAAARAARERKKAKPEATVPGLPFVKASPSGKPALR